MFWFKSLEDQSPYSTTNGKIHKVKWDMDQAVFVGTVIIVTGNIVIGSQLSAGLSDRGSANVFPSVSAFFSPEKKCFMYDKSRKFFLLNNFDCVFCVHKTTIPRLSEGQQWKMEKLKFQGLVILVLTSTSETLQFSCIFLSSQSLDSPGGH